MYEKTEIKNIQRLILCFIQLYGDVEYIIHYLKTKLMDSKLSIDVLIKTIYQKNVIELQKFSHSFSNIWRSNDLYD